MINYKKEQLIKKHLGVNTPKWIIDNCIALINEFEEIEWLKVPQKQANDVDTEQKALHIDSVMPRFSVSLVYQNVKSIMLRTLILNAKDKANALLETIEYFKEETDGMGLVLKAVIELNEA